MSNSQDTEIVLKEKNGSSRERIYVKPHQQTKIVILDNFNPSDVTDWFTRIFLPQGYPDSVSKDYMAYQIWDTAQAFCSTITGILATQEVFRGVGVGDTTATPLAATITWVLKDGCGHFGKILFAYSHGAYLDAYSKKWRLYADTLNNAAMCIEIALPLFKNYIIFALCVSTVTKAIVGVAGGATRAAMTQHHAIHGNMADVYAKDSAQETAVNLVASFTALFVITVFGNSLFIFIMMTILHMVFNYYAVRAVCLRTLNEPRFLQVIDLYLRRGVIAEPCQINRTEPIIFYQMGTNLLDLKLSGFRIKLGHSIKDVVGQYPKASHLKSICKIYKNRNYILMPNTRNRKMYILVKEAASADDILRAYFHAIIFSITICAINYDNQVIYAFPLDLVCDALQSGDWTREPIDDSSGADHNNFVYEPSAEFMVYVDEIAHKEWQNIRLSLARAGWDLKKHLLVVDKWRV